MFEVESNVQTVNPSGLSAASKCLCGYGSENESVEEEWVKENEEEENRNIFDILDEKEDLWIEIIIFSCMERIDKSTYWWH